MYSFSNKAYYFYFKMYIFIIFFFKTFYKILNFKKNIQQVFEAYENTVENYESNISKDVLFSKILLEIVFSNFFCMFKTIIQQSIQNSELQLCIYNTTKHVNL